MSSHPMRDLMFELAETNPYLNKDYKDKIEAPAINFNIFYQTGERTRSGVVVSRVWGHLPVPAKTLIEWSMVLLGSTGFGKTNTLSVFLENMLKKQWPFFLLDHKGEQEGLHDKEKGWPSRIKKIEKITDGTYRTVKVGKGEKQVKNSCGKADAAKFVSGMMSFRLDARDFIFTEKELLFQYLYDFLREWHLLMAQIKQADRIVHLVVIDEAHNYCPEDSNTNSGFYDAELAELLKNYIITLAKEGRSLGIQLWNISQRPAQLAKGLTTQAANAILLPVNSGPDIKTYELLTNFKNKELRVLLAEMRPDSGRGKCFFICNQGLTLAWVRPKETPDGGRTPGVEKLSGFVYGEGVVKS